MIFFRAIRAGAQGTRQAGRGEAIFRENSFRRFVISCLIGRGEEPGRERGRRQRRGEALREDGSAGRKSSMNPPSQC